LVYIFRNDSLLMERFGTVQYFPFVVYSTVHHAFFVVRVLLKKHLCLIISDVVLVSRSFFLRSLQWAGKTIALGTFPSAEADEKCARAKALTRAWRSTMRPKPSREWVMVELERLGVRVVSGRLGRKLGEGEEEDGLPGGIPGRGELKKN
jgi:hypothetical protein